MSKSEVSKAYAEKVRAEHGSKEWDGGRKLLVSITGTARPGSIGEGIASAVRDAGNVVVTRNGDVKLRWSEGTFAHHDALIMSHGAQTMNWFEEADMDEVESVVDVNLTGSYRVAQRFVRDTIDSAGRKKIIMIGSMAHKAILNGSAMYCASKAGLSMLAKCMAWELAPKGYDVYIIHPSNVDGAPMAEDTINGLMAYRGISRAEAEAYWGDSYLRNASLSIEEIAAVCMFLLGDNAAYLSGTDINLGGGQR